ncbi:MAG TPA: hypothetical protein VFN31_03285, partial [Candidatus Saccharimonadales bacterium]|nr:hypothetical protein [Candidatus Saccharimonadales bacterium]
DTGAAGTSGSTQTSDQTARIGVGTTTPSANLDVLGTTTLQSAVNSTTAFQVQNTAGTSLLTVDTANGQSLFNGDVSIGSGLTRLFSDGFESGNFNSWNGGVTQSGSATATVVSSPVHTGHYAAQFVETGAGYSHVVAGITMGTTTVIQSYINVASQGASDLNLESVGTSSPNFTSVYRQQTTGYISIYDLANNTSYVSTTVLPLNSWHELEVDITFSTTTGSITIYMDGTQVLNETSIDTGTIPPNLAIGDGYTGGTHVGTFTMDDVVVGTTSASGQTGNLNVGDSLHVGGNSSFGSGVIIQPASDSTTAFQVDNSSGSNVLSVDTLNQSVKVTGKSGSTADAFIVQNASGTSQFNIDTTNSIANIDTNNTYIKPGTNNANTFQVQDSSGTTVLGIDTSADQLLSGIASGGTAFTLNTTTAYASGYLLKLDNNSTTEFSIDSSGTVVAAGTVTASNGPLIGDGFGTVGSKVIYGSNTFTSGTVGFVSYGVTFTSLPMVVASNGDTGANTCTVGVNGSAGGITMTGFYVSCSTTGNYRVNWIAVGH